MRASRSLRLWVCCLVMLTLASCGGSGSSTPTLQPTASITIPVAVPVSAIVTLDGSGSAARNGGTLIYAWTLTSKPVGSTATISNTTIATPSLTVDVAGTYAIGLTVTEGPISTTIATATVAAASTLPAILSDLVDPVSGSTQLSLTSDPGAESVTWSVDGGTALNTGSTVTTVNTGTALTWDTTTVTNNASHTVVALFLFPGYTTTASRTFQVSQSPVSFSSETVSQSAGVYYAIVGAQSANGIAAVSATLDGVAVGRLTAPNACVGDTTGAACATTGSNGYAFTGPVASTSAQHVVVVTAIDGAGNQLGTQLRFTY